MGFSSGQAALSPNPSYINCFTFREHSPVSLWVTEVKHQLWRNNHRSTLALPAAKLLLRSAFCLLKQFCCPCERHPAPCRISCSISDPIPAGAGFSSRVDWRGELQGFKVGNIHGFMLPAPS